jgi:hypothetical protein
VTPPDARALLAAADAARAGNDIATARSAYLDAFEAARAADDADAMAQAALGLSNGQMYGAVPGRIPAILHQAYLRVTGEQQAWLAVALARVWVYGGDAARAVTFAKEAFDTAQSADDPVLLAAALDAQLLVHWGPDDLAERLHITRQLEDAAAHVPDVETRLTALLWRLTTALETLDLPTVQRQLRGLDVLAEESRSARVRFFAAARRGMHALLVGDLVAAATALDAVAAAGREAAEPDTNAMERTLSSGIARQRGDLDGLRREAELYEEFGTGEGVPAVAAEGAVLWLAAGDRDRAGSLLERVAGADFGAIPRDGDWLLTVSFLCEVAVGVGSEPLMRAALDVLTPYAGRGVVNGGGAAFAGVVDDYLARAADGLGRETAARAWAAAAGQAYRRMGATWWTNRSGTAGAPSAQARAEPRGTLLYPTAGGAWSVGSDEPPAALPDMKGLHHLRLLLRRPDTDIPALTLSDAAAGHAGAGVSYGDTGAVLDRQALAAYRRRLDELDDELDGTSASGDAAKADRLEQERTALLEELRRATGLGGRVRTTGAADERARVAVQKAIAAAIRRVEEADPGLGRLLRSTVTTGRVCRYAPDPDRPVTWVLDEPTRAEA